MRELLEATQDAAKIYVQNSSGHEGKLNTNANPIVWATGLGTGETIKIQLPTTPDPDVNRDAHWEDMYMDGASVALSETNNIFAFYSITAVRLVKESTTGDVGIMGSGWSLRLKKD